MSNSKRKCALKSCGIRFRPADGIVRGLQAWCGEDHQIEWAVAAGRKLRAHKASQELTERKKAFRLQNHRHQFDLTKRAAQQLANLLDAALPCICCNRPRKPGVQFCGGHYKTGGGHPELAVDLRNIHGQENYGCNCQRSGNISGDKHSHGFKAGLVLRYGQELVDWLDGHHPAVKLTGEQLQQIRKTYMKEIRHIKAGGQPTRDWRSINDKGPTYDNQL